MIESGEIMDEKTAYRIAAEILNPVEGKIPAHLGQQVADRIVAALLSAQQQVDSIVINGGGE